MLDTILADVLAYFMLQSSSWPWLLLNLTVLVPATLSLLRRKSLARELQAGIQKERRGVEVREKEVHARIEIAQQREGDALARIEVAQQREEEARARIDVAQRHEAEARAQTEAAEVLHREVAERVGSHESMEARRIALEQQELSLGRRVQKLAQREQELAQQRKGMAQRQQALEEREQQCKQRRQTLETDAQAAGQRQRDLAELQQALEQRERLTVAERDAVDASQCRVRSTVQNLMTALEACHSWPAKLHLSFIFGMSTFCFGFVFGGTIIIPISIAWACSIVWAWAYWLQPLLRAPLASAQQQVQELSQATLDSSLKWTCSVCFEKFPVSYGVRCATCEIFTCTDCFERYVAAELTSISDSDNRLEQHRHRRGAIKCLHESCSTCVGDRILAQHVSDTTYRSYMEAHDNVVLFEPQASVRQLEAQLEIISDAEALAATLGVLIPNAHQCGRCGFGPVDHFACADLAAHNGQRVGGTRINNACPQCGWFSSNINDWPAWNGRLPQQGNPRRRR